MFNCASDSHGPPSASITHAWVQLMRAQQLVLTAIKQELRDADLPPLCWYDVLLELARAEGGKLRPCVIEQHTLMAQHNLSRLIDRMEEKGLVAREVLQSDGRGRQVSITEAGRAVQLRMCPVYASAIQRHLGRKLDDNRADQLAELLAVFSRGSLGTDNQSMDVRS